MAGSMVAGIITTSIMAILIMAGGATALRMGTQGSPGMAAKVAMAASPRMVVAAGMVAAEATVESGRMCQHGLDRRPAVRSRAV
jgi:hypothetical protein